MSEITMERIRGLCRAYADAERLLAERTEHVQEVRRSSSGRLMPGLRSAAAELSAARDELRDAVESSPQLFERPRTRALEGVKVGFRKLPGTIDCLSEAKVIERIRRVRPELEATLVAVRESLVKAALKKLDSRDLAAIGVSITAVDDEVVIRTAKTDIDALVDALLAEFEEEADAA